MRKLHLTPQLTRLLAALYNCPGLVGESVVERAVRSRNKNNVKICISRLRTALPTSVQIESIRMGDCYCLHGRENLVLTGTTFYILEQSSGTAQIAHTIPVLGEMSHA